MMKLPTAAAILTSTLLLPSVASSSTQTPNRRRQLRPKYLTPDDISSLVPQANYDHEKSRDKWISVSEDVQFLPLMDTTSSLSSRQTRLLQKSMERTLQDEYSDFSGANHTHGAYSQNNPYSVQPFIEGMGGYDEYQQAWRLLGFIIDCNDVIYDDDYAEEGGHSNDGTLTGEGCGRYVMWAAYVDTEYEGGGIGEYQYYDRDSGKWDDSPCYIDKDTKYEANDDARKLQGGDNNNENNNGGKSRCAKMDCHLEDTHFSVLGFFKHRSHDDWMEQLFKHEGVCVWTEEEYDFMKGARRAWPKGCTETGQERNGKPLYYDIQPLRNGRIAPGLYTDTQCLEEYTTNAKTVESIIGNVFANVEASHDNGDGEGNDYSNDSLSDSMKRWDSAFDVWTYCHPCKTHDLENTDGSKYADYFGYDDEYYKDDDDDGNDDQNNRRLGFEKKPKGDVFECYDDARYTNVNQCMKFSAKTVMKTATFRDISLGRHQGTLVTNPLSGYVVNSMSFSKHRATTAFTYILLIGASSAFAYSAFNLYKLSRRSNVGDGDNRDSLL